MEKKKINKIKCICKECGNIFYHKRQKCGKLYKKLNCDRCLKEIRINNAVNATNAYKDKYNSDEQFKQKMINHRKGKSPSVETRTKLRIAMLNRIKTQVGNVYPNYNPTACKIIEEYGKENGYNFQHAENGGEFYIEELGYWVDGYDKDKNVVIEVDETFHKKQQKRDLIRQQQIETLLDCKFVRINIG